MHCFDTCEDEGQAEDRGMDRGLRKVVVLAILEWHFQRLRFQLLSDPDLSPLFAVGNCFHNSLQSAALR